MNKPYIVTNNLSNKKRLNLFLERLAKIIVDISQYSEYSNLTSPAKTVMEEGI